MSKSQMDMGKDMDMDMYTDMTWPVQPRNDQWPAAPCYDLSGFLAALFILYTVWSAFGGL